ncbi:MAG: DUF58 domain-containing protein [Anaerolineae bacterium]|jgi:uncharacterized protein (DUF58 family)
MRGFLPYLLLLFLIAAVLRVDFFFSVVYLLLSVYVLSRLWTQRAAADLQAERTYTNRAFPGDQATLRLAVRNLSWLPIPWVHVHESLPVELSTRPFIREVTSLGPYAERTFTAVLDCHRRGYYEVGPLRMQLGDLLGVSRTHRVQVESQHLVVYPRVVPLQELGLPTRSPLVALPARTPLFEDPARITGVRGYQDGDSPRRIHWTATASSGELLVKRYDASIARETVIFLDLNQGDYEGRRRYTATELAIVVAASIAHHIVVSERLPVGFVTEGWDPLAEAKARFVLPPRADRASLMGLLEVLARVEVGDVAPFADVLRRESSSLTWGTTLAVVAGRATEALFDTLVHLRHAGFALALILIQPTGVTEDLRRQADLLGVPVHRVWREPLSFAP